MKSSKIVYTKVSNKNSKNLNNIITNGQILYKFFYKMSKFIYVNVNGDYLRFVFKKVILKTMFCYLQVLQFIIKSEEVFWNFYKFVV